MFNSDDISVVDETIAEPKTFEDEDKVIADLKFFISKDDFNKNQNRYLDAIKDEKISRYSIGKYEAMSFPEAYFDNDSLYYVEFRGQPTDFKDFDTRTKRQYKSLYDLYESKYGRPTYELIPFPKVYETTEGQYITLSEWVLGKRTISIKLTERNGFQTINLCIFRNDIRDRIRLRNELESKKCQEDAQSII